MSNKIFVGNLPFSATASDLQALFAGFGAIKGDRTKALHHTLHHTLPYYLTTLL
jgi:RNA recognition motif-containing protein